MHIGWVPEFAIWGGVGGLIAVLAKSGCFELPHIKDGKLYLGGLQGIAFGVVAGLIGDANPWNALMWGAGGTTLVRGLVHTADKAASTISRKKAA